jgi:TonB family protein
VIPVFCSQPDRPAALVRAAVPVLPPMALQQGIGGLVRVRVALDARGNVRDVVVTRTPSHVLDRESLRTARESTFAPARRRCVNVASAYEFRVLYDPERPREPSPPAPTPSPSPTPPPALNLALPWTLVWSESGSSSYSTRTLSSTRRFTRVDDTFPTSHHAECHATLSGAAFERAVAALRRSSPERWRPSYGIGAEATPIPAPAPAPTTAPAADVVAVVRGQVFIPRTADGASSGLTLTTGGSSYRTSFEYGSSWYGAEPISAEVQDVMRALRTADAECAARTKASASNPLA